MKKIISINSLSIFLAGIATFLLPLLFEFGRVLDEYYLLITYSQFIASLSFIKYIHEYMLNDRLHTRHSILNFIYSFTIYIFVISVILIIILLLIQSNLEENITLPSFYLTMIIITPLICCRMYLDAYFYIINKIYLIYLFASIESLFFIFLILFAYYFEIDLVSVLPLKFLLPLIIGLSIYSLKRTLINVFICSSFYVKLSYFALYTIPPSVVNLLLMSNLFDYKEGFASLYKTLVTFVLRIQGVILKPLSYLDSRNLYYKGDFFHIDYINLYYIVSSLLLPLFCSFIFTLLFDNDNSISVPILISATILPSFYLIRYRKYINLSVGIGAILLINIFLSGFVLSLSYFNIIEEIYILSLFNNLLLLCYSFVIFYLERSKVRTIFSNIMIVLFCLCLIQCLNF